MTITRNYLAVVLIIGIISTKLRVASENKSLNILIQSKLAINNFLQKEYTKIPDDIPTLKENRIEAVFKRVAYGQRNAGIIEQRSSNSVLADNNNWKQIKDQLKSENENHIKGKSFYGKINHSEAPEVSGLIYKAFPQSLLREVPHITDEDFTLFEIHTPRFKLHTPNEEKYLHNYDKETTNASDTIEILNNGNYLSNSSSVQILNVHNENRSEANLLCSFLSTAHLRGKATFVIIAALFCTSFFPLVGIYQIIVRKKRHVAPYYSSFILIDIIIVCMARIILYLTNYYFGNYSFVQSFTSHVLKHGLWGLNHAVGVFTVILIFPIFRPKSSVFPRIICISLSVLLSFKIAVSFFGSLLCSEYNFILIFKLERLSLTALNFGETVALFICMIALSVLAKQRHKIWWIRMYKNSVNSCDSSMHVLYSQLKKSIRLGSAATFIQLFNTILFNISEFNIELPYIPFGKEVQNDGIEVLNRILEMLVSLMLTFGVRSLFACNERSTIRRKNLLKKVIDVVKGKRLQNSGLIREDFRLPLSIFTVNKTSKTPDSVTSDFQLVWNSERNLPSSQTFSDEYKGQILKAAHNNEISNTNANRGIPFAHSYSAGSLRNVGQSCHKRNSNELANSINSNEEMLHKNSFFKYNYTFIEPYHQPENVKNNNGSINGVRKKQKKAKQVRPKSLVLLEGQDSQQCVTSYVSALSQENVMSLDDLGILLGSRSTIVGQTFNLTNRKITSGR